MTSIDVILKENDLPPPHSSLLFATTITMTKNRNGGVARWDANANALGQDGRARSVRHGLVATVLPQYTARAEGVARRKRWGGKDGKRRNKEALGVVMPSQGAGGER